jgi:hypothetical protein
MQISSLRNKLNNSFNLNSEQKNVVTSQNKNERINISLGKFILKKKFVQDSNKKSKIERTDGVQVNESKIKINSNKIGVIEKENKRHSNKISKKQIFAYDNDDLNELNFEEALIYDNRNFCIYYCFMIKVNNIIINTFCRFSDYNLFVIKAGLLLILFPINLTFNSLFFTNSQINDVYLNSFSKITTDWKSFLRSFGSSIISSIFLGFLELLCLTHDTIRGIKKETKLGKAKRKASEILNTIKIRISIYFLFSLIFILIFGFYISCFCVVFENTQTVLMKDMFISWLLSLVYPFLIYFLISIFRKMSLLCKLKCCYGIHNLLQINLPC